MSQLIRPGRAYFPHFASLATRWEDNDLYGHTNNAVYFSYFDTVVNQWLIAQGLLNLSAPSERIGLVVSNQCDYFASVAFPDLLDIGLGIARLGNSSVQFHLGVFKQGAANCAALGRFTHVYVEPQNRQSAPLPTHWREKFQSLLMKEPL